MHDDKVGIVVFAGEAQSIMPLTSDYTAAETYIDAIETNVVRRQGTDFLKAVEVAADKFKNIPNVFEIFHYLEAFGFAYSTEYLESVKKYSSNKLDYLFIEGINNCFYSRHHYKKDFFEYFSPAYFSMTQEAYTKRLKYVKPKELKKLSNLIYKKFKSNEIDLHSKNFMFRKRDDCLIINDPLY